jgi:hypothetical protein
MRKKFASIAVLLALMLPAAFVVPVQAQGFNPAQSPPWVFADNYGRWVLQGQLPNTFTFQVSGFSPCQITNLGFGNTPTFYAFSDAVGLAPVFIQDNNASQSEVITPSVYLAPTPQSCGPSLSALNTHTTFSLQSGTGGLQEAINTVGGFTASYPTVVFLTPEWYKLVTGISSQNSTLAAITPATIIAAAKGSVTAIVTDVTTAPPTQYVWNGTAYASGTQYWVKGAAPTLAAGAGAGTSPTIAITGNSVSGTVTLTTGTAVPASASAIFTLTWPNLGTAGSPSSGFSYAPACTFTSTGTAPGVTTNTSSYGSSHAVATLTSPAAGLASSTAGYSWTYVCH